MFSIVLAKSPVRLLIMNLILKWQDKGMTKVKQTSSNVKNLEKLSLLKTEERNAVLEFADLLRERFGFLIKEVVLFGSKARGESDQESDIRHLNCPYQSLMENKEVHF
jgi:hypothetical protein